MDDWAVAAAYALKETLRKSEPRFEMARIWRIPAVRCALAAICLAGAFSVVEFISSATVAYAGTTFSCSNLDHDGVGADGTTSPSGIDGVEGYVYVPNYGASNLHGQPTIVSDIAAILIDDHFFQFGWYIGATDTGLPYTAVPHLFAGEGNLATGAETLTDLGLVATGTYQYLQLYRNENASSPSHNHYLARVNGGAILWTSVMANAYSAYPRMLGESNYDCADLYAFATTSSGGPTLGLHHGGGSWALWQQHSNVRFGTPANVPGCWQDLRVNDYGATVYAYRAC